MEIVRSYGIGASNIILSGEHLLQFWRVRRRFPDSIIHVTSLLDVITDRLTAIAGSPGETKI